MFTVIKVPHKALSTWDFSGSPVVKTLCFYSWGRGSTLVGELRPHIPHAMCSVAPKPHYHQQKASGSPLKCSCSHRQMEPGGLQSLGSQGLDTTE